MIVPRHEPIRCPQHTQVCTSDMYNMVRQLLSGRVCFSCTVASCTGASACVSVMCQAETGMQRWLDCCCKCTRLARSLPGARAGAVLHADQRAAQPVPLVPGVCGGRGHPGGACGTPAARVVCLPQSHGVLLQGCFAAGESCGRASGNPVHSSSFCEWQLVQCVMMDIIVCTVAVDWVGM